MTPRAGNEPRTAAGGENKPAPGGENKPAPGGVGALPWARSRGWGPGGENKQ